MQGNRNAKSLRNEEIRLSLTECRRLTLQLLDAVPDDFLRRRVHSFYSPVGWHFGHVGRTEEYWVIGEALKRPLLDDRLTFLFADLADNPKDNRVNIPDRAGIIEYLARTRERVIMALDEADLDSDDPHLRDGYAWEFAIQHEYQHQETIYEMLQLIQKELGPSYDELYAWRPGGRREWVELDGGSFAMGSSRPHFYDNEKDPHTVFVEPFRMSKTPVTAFEWSVFMSEGGYLQRGLWSSEGWAWRESENAAQPEYWVRQGDGRGSVRAPRDPCDPSGRACELHQLV